ncbi:MAG: hypothetical protein HQL37_10555 [Alphaproteobacteria bacterium]|nr:hypothetical protein [Alphaproteobacteria bacterium]
MDEMPRTPPAAGDLSNALNAAREALTDGMVERMASTAANAMELVDAVNDEDTREALQAAIAALTKLHKIGAIDTLVELVMVAHAARTAVSDSMIERLFAFGEHMINNLATEEVATLAHETRAALEDALDQTVGAPAKGGLLNVMRMMGSPSAAQTLNFLLTFGNNLRQRAQILSKSSDT